MSVYSLAIPVPGHHWKDQDTEGIQLPMNRDLWATEIMWSTLRMMPSLSTEPWIVGGDLNTSVLFDIPKPRGNQLILDRMAEIGLPSIDLSGNGEPVPTFRSSRGHFVHQLDHLFANHQMLDHLIGCEVYEDTERIFGSRPMLSDHLPIIADFDIP
jgi:endonuclease/exonuclease/phosphatase (EEP) superfamily protein YafD